VKLAGHPPNDKVPVLFGKSFGQIEGSLTWFAAHPRFDLKYCPGENIGEIFQMVNLVAAKLREINHKPDGTIYSLIWRRLLKRRKPTPEQTEFINKILKPIVKALM